MQETFTARSTGARTGEGRFLNLPPAASCGRFTHFAILVVVWTEPILGAASSLIRAATSMERRNMGEKNQSARSWGSDVESSSKSPATELRVSFTPSRAQ